MNEKHFFWHTLKLVSRSFYLSLRALPSPIRQPISLAYLLARATDTLADTTTLPYHRRIENILLLQEMIQNPKKQLTLQNLSIQTNEKILLDHIPFFINQLLQQNHHDIGCIQTVLHHIIQAQLFDLTYFSDKSEVTALTTDAELENYLYLIAGCVGEFWTKIAIHHINHYTEQSLETLLPQAIHFGKFLQLTNILQDIPADLTLGRLYLPIHEKHLTKNQAIEYLLTDKNTLNKWHHTAQNYCQDALRYTHALKNKRSRFACFLPIYIGQETLQLLQNTQYIKQAKKNKISRSKIYWYMGKSILSAI